MIHYMKKIHLFAFIGIMLLSSCISDNINKQEPTLQFNKDGKFKIAQFTDTHITIPNPTEYEKALSQMKYILDTEKPDLAIFTGDIVTDVESNRAWKEFLAPLDERNIPFAVVLGNHDREQELSEREIMNLVMAHPSNINIAAEGGYLDDFVIKIRSSKDDKTASLLYLMDSNDYSTSEFFDDYGWITSEQVQWYINSSKSYTKQNGNVPCPSYAFFHIPLQEYSVASGRKTPYGYREENECPGELNSGLLSAMVECGDVQGIFTGHDHDDDYIAEMGGISLVYGRYSGYNTVYNHLPHGVRIIELKENDYGFRTWIRERDGKIVTDTTITKNIDYKLRKATASKGKENGIKRSEFVGNITSIDNMTKDGTLQGISLLQSPRIPTHDDAGVHGYVYEGMLMFPESGLWSIHITGEEYARLTIDDTSCDGHFYHRGQTRINLEKGLHPIKIEFINTQGGERLKLQWKRQGSSRYHEIPDKNYFIK
jgi:hypothetical protein